MNGKPLENPGLSEGTPGGYYRCALDAGYSFLHVSDRFLDILGWTAAELKEEFGNRFENMLHPDDRGQDGKNAERVCRLRGKNGYCWVSNATAWTAAALEGWIADISPFVEKIENQEKQQDAMRISSLETQLDTERQYLDILCRDFVSVFHVNLKMNAAIPLKLDPLTNAGKMDIQLRQEIAYDAMVDVYSRNYVADAYSAGFRQFMSEAGLRRTLRETERCAYRYICHPNEGGHEHFEVQALRIKDDPLDTNVLIAFRYIDDQVTEEQKQQFELEERLERERMQNEDFAALSGNYQAIFRRDLQKDSYTKVACSEQIRHYYDESQSAASRMLEDLCDRIIAEKDYERMRAFFDLSTLAQRLRDRPSVEAECITRGGNWHRAQLIARRRDAGGEATHALYVTHVIDDEKQYEEHLIAKAEYANQANQSKSSFVSQVAHDIRTPMNSIFGFLEIAEANADNAEKVRYSIGKIRAAGEFLKNLVNDVLDISRMEDGRFTLQLEQVSLSNLLEDVFSSMRIAAAEKNQNFCMRMGEFAHDQIIADELRVMQIYTNVISNAIKYTPVGGNVDFTIHQQEIPGQERVRIVAEIVDNGIGMSEEFLEKMFMKFERATDTRINKVSGYGLGLSIVKQLLDMMGGSVDVRSQLGVGTRFHIELEVPFVAKTAAQSAQAETDYAAICAGMRLLVAEDNALNREVITELLAMYGMKCECAEDGRQCMERFQLAPEGSYDVILMDMQMPVMNGVDATRQIRMLPTPGAQTIPIIAMTANAMRDDVKKCMDAGMNSHLSKPVDMAQLLKTLAELKMNK